MWIDDDLNYLKVQRELIWDEGWVTEAFADIDEAVAYVRSPKKSFKGVILDLQMAPGDCFRDFDHMGGLRTGFHFLELCLSEGLLEPSDVVVYTNSQDEELVDIIDGLNVKVGKKRDYMGSRLIELLESAFGKPDGASRE